MLTAEQIKKLEELFNRYPKAFSKASYQKSENGV